VIHSMVGHDGFLVEQDALGKIIRHALGRTRSVRHGASS
jgi:homoserine acetyltransferase